MDSDVHINEKETEFGEIFGQNHGHYARQLTSEEVNRLQKDNCLVSDFKQAKLDKDAQKNWDLFYKRNSTKFFKDRHWTRREFKELCGVHTDILSARVESKEKRVLLEIGCGVGNFMFPLIAQKTKLFIHACDFSNRAIDFVKANPLYDDAVCHAFQCDITKDDLSSFIPENSVDFVSLIFVFSSLHPNAMPLALANLRRVLKPQGIVLFRDYGLFDQAMLRFASGHKLGDQFYVRQDGTRAFYFSEGACSHVEQKLERDLIFLAWHHITVLMFGTAFKMTIEDAVPLKVPKRFKELATS